jgi:putative ABC transport system permease protein
MRLPFALLHALREWRSGIRRIGWFTASMALGIAVLVALYGFQRDMAASTRVEARALLGGDLRFQSSEPITPRVEAILDSLFGAGGEVSRGVALATVVFSPQSGRARLFQVNAVDSAFPLAGRAVGDPPEVPELLRRGGGVVPIHSFSSSWTPPPVRGSELARRNSRSSDRSRGSPLTSNSSGRRDPRSSCR